MTTQRNLDFQRFLIRWEGNTNAIVGESAESTYSRAMPFAFSNHPNDTGGTTMMGVTMRVFRVWRTSICHLPQPTLEDLRMMQYTEWEAILRYLYWEPLHADTLPFDCYALALADWYWHSGTAAVCQAQRLLGVEEDGIIGRKTINAAKRLMSTRERARMMSVQLTETRRRWLADLVARRPSQTVFARGWDNRLDALVALVPSLDLTPEERAEPQITQIKQIPSSL